MGMWEETDTHTHTHTHQSVLPHLVKSVFIHIIWKFIIYVVAPLSQHVRTCDGGKYVRRSSQRGERATETEHMTHITRPITHTSRVQQDPTPWAESHIHAHYHTYIASWTSENVMAFRDKSFWDKLAYSPSLNRISLIRGTRPILPYDKDHITPSMNRNGPVRGQVQNCHDEDRVRRLA